MKSKTTDTVQSCEQRMIKEYEILKDPNAPKDFKKAALKRYKLLEKHLRDVDNKHINGKKYPVRQKPQPVSKEELFKLIDSVPNYPTDTVYGLDTDDFKSEVDVTGVFTKGALAEQNP